MSRPLWVSGIIPYPVRTLCTCPVNGKAGRGRARDRKTAFVSGKQKEWHSKSGIKVERFFYLPLLPTGK